jgi:hypothetical protein
LNTNSDDRKNLSWQTFRIGRGVKKTNAIDAEEKNLEVNGIWLFAGEGALLQRKSLSPICGTKNMAIATKLN